MSSPPKRSAKYEDLLSVSDNMVGEIIAGVVVTHSRPGPRHSRAGLILGGMVSDRFDRDSTDGSDGWWILAEPECRMGSDVVVLNIAGWRRSTMPQFPDTAWVETIPDWVCDRIAVYTEIRPDG